jgi:hypothetical protein
VFALIGLFLVFAAVDWRSQEARGLGGALRLIQQQAYGSVLLGFAAGGLLAFAGYEFAEAAYAHIAAPSLERASARAGLKSRSRRRRKHV